MRLIHKTDQVPTSWLFLAVVSSILFQQILPITSSLVDAVNPGNRIHTLSKFSNLGDETLHDEASLKYELPTGVDSKDEDATDSLSVSPPSFFSRIQSAARDSIAPAHSYYDLVMRYRNWRNGYTELQEKYGLKADGQPRLANPMDVLRLEYAKVDKMLMSELCTGEDSKDGKTKAENMDLIFRILRILIDRLEANLSKIREEGPPDETADLETKEKLADIEHNVEEAVSRAKRIVSRSALNVIQNELTTVVKLFLFDMAASYMVNNGEMGAVGMAGVLGKLEPLAILMGNVNTPLLVSYLRNVQFRSAVKVAKDVMSSLKCLRPKEAPTKMTQQ